MARILRENKRKKGRPYLILNRVTSCFHKNANAQFSQFRRRGQWGGQFVGFRWGATFASSSVEFYKNVPLGRRENYAVRGYSPADMLAKTVRSTSPVYVRTGTLKCPISDSGGWVSASVGALACWDCRGNLISSVSVPVSSEQLHLKAIYFQKII